MDFESISIFGSEQLQSNFERVDRCNMLQSRPRLTADPTVSVADLCEPLEAYME